MKKAKMGVDIKISRGQELMPSQPSEPQDYEVDEAVRHMEKAEEIRKDSRLMPHVMKRIEQKHKTYTALKDMKKLAAKKSLEEQSEREKETPKEEKGESMAEEKAEHTIHVG